MRLLVYGIDNLILGSALAILDLVGLFDLRLLAPIYFFASVIYGIMLPALGGTPGMRIIGLRIVKASDDLSTIGLLASTLRYLGFLFSIIVFYIGVIWIAFDPEKQGWHDKIAHTRVIYVR